MEYCGRGAVSEAGLGLERPKASAIILLPNRTQTKISRNAEFQLIIKQRKSKRR